MKVTKQFLLITTCFLIIQCSQPTPPLVNLNKNDHIVLIGNNLCSRMIHYGHFETELQLRYSDSLLLIRNMCDGGDTPGFRPHSGRNDPWAFPGAEVFQTEFAQPSGSIGHLESPDEWLESAKADIIIAFFGYSESFQGIDGLDNYKKELEAFISHTQSQKYNGKSKPELVLVSPAAFEDLTAYQDLPNGEKENTNLKLYADATGDDCYINECALPGYFYSYFGLVFWTKRIDY